MYGTRPTKHLPKTHLKYRHLIENQGGVVTDFWSTATMEPSNFIKRNRLIAGLSEATVLLSLQKKEGVWQLQKWPLDITERFLRFLVEQPTSRAKAVTI